MPRLSSKKRPPILLHSKGGSRGFHYGGQFITLYSPLTNEELTEDIMRGFDVEEHSGGSDTSEPEPRDNIDPPQLNLDHPGLYDDEISDIATGMGLYKHGYLGTYSIDKIHTLVKYVKDQPALKKQFGFIFNTDPSDKPGQHWIAVCYIKQLQELDYYNSLAEEPTEQFREEIKPVIDALNLPYYLKFKVNMIPRQDKSENCGWHALDFLYKMLVPFKSKDGKSHRSKFKFATGYSDIRDGEKKINKLKNDIKSNIKKFGYIA
jgi:hypothetical protein